MKFFEDKKKLRDVILVAALLIIAAGAWLFIELSRTDGKYVVVVVDGTETARYSLAEDAEFTLESANGGYNKVVISGGKADVTEASCPDKVCVNQHSINRTGETITCLPNKTVLKVIGESEAETEIDFVS